jgi:hypothetical protein
MTEQWKQTRLINCDGGKHSYNLRTPDGWACDCGKKELIRIGPSFLSAYREIPNREFVVNEKRR